MCRKGRELVDDVLLDCEFIGELLGMVLLLFEVPWMILCLMVKFLQIWKDFRMHNRIGRGGT